MIYILSQYKSCFIFRHIIYYIFFSFYYLFIFLFIYFFLNKKFFYEHNTIMKLILVELRVI